MDDNKPLTEQDSIPGDLFENAKGDRYLALPNGMLAFLGNKDSRIEGLVTKRNDFVRILRRVQLPQYKDPTAPRTFQDDWDDLRGVKHFRAPLPHGCTCTHDALEVILKCSVHKVRAEVSFITGATSAVARVEYPMGMIRPYEDDDDLK